MEIAKQMLKQLRSTYLNELPGSIEEIEKILIELEKFGFAEESFNNVFRLVHSLKGSGGTYGLHEITSICHRLEDLLTKISENHGKLCKSLAFVSLAYIDLLRDVADDYSFNDSCSIDIEACLRALQSKAFPKSRTALIVECSSLIVGYLSECFLAHNVHVEVLNDGYEALGRALAEPFDFVITGMEIHRLNGAALIAALRLAQGNNSATKTILLTTNPVSFPPVIKPSFTILKNEHLSRKLGAILSPEV